MSIHLTNTLTRKKELFNPIKANHVGIYTCGPTVYNYAHIGNLRAYVFADTLKRMFLLNGYAVNHVMNITDVGHLTSDADEGEDKMTKGAKREGKTVWEVAQFYTDAFMDDTMQLNIIPPNHITKATAHINEMIDLIKMLEANGFTYISNGNVYFDTSKYDGYGKMAKLKLDDKATQSRVEKDPDKRHPFDFVLWFTRHKYANHAMEWDSPWGRGFPGWHIECSAMSSKYLGDHFDIHTGGIDHIPVHHTNEIAQSDCAFGHKTVNYWLHNDFLIIGDSEKMAKSGDNFLRLKVITDKGYSPLEYRYFLLGTHYRKPVNFSFDALDSAKNAMARLRNRILDFQKETSEKTDETAVKKYSDALLKELNDDLNTPKCLALLWEVVDSGKLSSQTKLEILNKFDEALGLGLSSIKAREIPAEISEIIEHRNEARKNKDWKKSDELRDILLKKGYQVLDSKEGTEVRKI